MVGKVARRALPSGAVNVLPTAFAAVGEDIARQRENMRGVLARMIISLVILLALLITVFVWTTDNPDSAQLLITGVFTPIIGIAGTVLGFYFGEQSAKGD